MKRSNKGYRTLIIVLLGIIATLLYRQDRGGRVDQAYIDSVLSDTLRTYRDSMGRHTAVINNLQIRNSALKSDILHKDSLLKRALLRATESDGKIKDLTVIVSNLRNNTTVETIVRHDTAVIRQDFGQTSPLVRPVYAGSYSDPFLRWSGLATADSFNVDITALLDLEIIKRSQRKNILAPRTHYIEVLSNNPYVEIQNVRGLTVEEGYSRWSVGVHAGYGVTHHDKILRLSPYIGIGLTYELFDFSWLKR